MTRKENKKHKGQASKVEKALARLGNDVHQALAFMNTDTGKLLNYRQLTRNPKYKKNRSTSSAKKIGRLANGVGGQIKNPTSTIIFIRRKDIPHNLRKDVTYGKCICSVQPEQN